MQQWHDLGSVVGMLQTKSCSRIMVPRCLALSLSLAVGLLAGCGYFRGADVDYELRVGPEVVNSVTEGRPIVAGTTVDEAGFLPDLLLCRGEDDRVYFSEGVFGDTWSVAEDDEASVISGVGLGGELTENECPVPVMGAEARVLDDDAFECGESRDEFDPALLNGPVVAEVPRRQLEEDEVGCYVTAVVYRQETDPPIVVFELNELVE